MKKISKILSTLLAVCMIVTMMATPVMANTGNVLEVGTGKTYTTLAVAVVAANAGDTIKLFEDIAITETCTIDKNITVDFNTYHINISGISEAAYSGIKIVTGATVTFNGTGGINAETNCVDNQGGTIVFNGGHYTTSNINRGTALNIDAGTVTVNTGVSVDAARFAVYNEVGATCILKGGTLVSRSHNGVGNYSYCVKNAGTMEIYDGVVIRGIQGGLAASGMGTTTVYGGTIETYEGSDSIGKSFYACYAANNANLTILGGSFTAAKRASLYIGNEDSGLDGAKVVIKGGTFTSNGGAEAAVIQTDIVGDLLIYGGTFGSDVSKYVSIGYYQKQNDDKTYTVEIMPVLNATTNTRYPDIEEAAKAAKNGEIIHVYPGDYNIMRDDVTLVEGQAGWYLPITTSISIIGVDENGVEITDPTQTKANIYSVDYKANGAHASQDLMSIFADNVIVKGLTIMNKVEANKGLTINGKNNITVENCKFAPIPERLIPAGGVKNETQEVVYTYAEYKEYGSGVYFAGTTTNSSVKNNLFSYSGLTFDSTDNSTINVENNTFNGLKNWNNDPAYYYSAIGYTSWENPAVLDISNSTLTIKKNKFINTGKVNFGKVTNGTVDATDNYWGSATPDFTKLVVGNVNVSPYFSDEAMTKKDSVTEQTAFTVANNAELSEALLKAGDGATITLKANTDVGNKYNKISIYKNNITIVGETGVTATIEGIDIYGKGTVLKNLTSSENIVIMDAVGNGNVKLDGITIATGKILDVRGGGKNSVVITGGTSIPGVKINKEITAAGAEIVRIVVDSTASIANISVDSAGTIQVNGTQIAKVDVNTTDSVSIAGGGTIPTLNVASGIVTVQEGSTVGTATITGGLTDIKGTATTVNVSAGETTVSGTATTLNTTGGNTILSGTATTLNTTGGDTTTTPASKVTGIVTSNGGTTTVGGSAATVTATSGAVTTEKTAIVQQLNANGGTAKVSGKIENATVAGTTVTVDTGANIAAATISAGSIAGTATDSVIGKIEVAGGTVDTTSKIVSATIENGVTSPGFTKDSGNVLNITDKNAGNTNNKTTATATFELVGQTVNQNAGTMTVDLKLTNAVQGVAGFKAVVDYSAFSNYITNATASTIAPNGVLMIDNGAGKITLTMAKGENIATNSVLATLTFNIKDDYYDVVAKSGKLGLTVSSAGYIDTLDTTGTPSREILPANIIVIGGEVVIEPWKYMLGDTDKNMNFNLMDIINTMVEVNRNEKKFKPWQKAATNIVIESSEPITSNPTAVDAQAMLEAFHYGTPLLRK